MSSLGYVCTYILTEDEEGMMCLDVAGESPHTRFQDGVSFLNCLPGSTSTIDINNSDQVSLDTLTDGLYRDG